jgi:uncharacterized protein (DUF2267 family)
LVPVFPGQPPIAVSFNVPAGGRGYYRTPSLVSMWATAPYLHNNALGKYTGGVAVEARIQEFNDAVTKLLWPEKRDKVIKRTDRDSALLPGILQAVPRLLADRLTMEFAGQLRAKLPANLADAAIREFQPLLARALREAVGKVKELSAADVQVEVARIIDEKVKSIASDLDLPADLVGSLHTALRQRLQQDMEMMRAVSRLKIGKIPTGTPVNLYANLGISKVPYAVLANLLERPGSREWAEALLKLSECPDLVEDKGHTYGAAEMTDAEKKDLIEFLKTF